VSKFTRTIQAPILWINLSGRQIVACVASVFVGYAARLKHFSLFARAKIGARAQKIFSPRPNFSAAKKQKIVRKCEKPAETLTTQAR